MVLQKIHYSQSHRHLPRHKTRLQPKNISIAKRFELIFSMSSDLLYTILFPCFLKYFPATCNGFVKKKKNPVGMPARTLLLNIPTFTNNTSRCKFHYTKRQGNGIHYNKEGAQAACVSARLMIVRAVQSTICLSGNLRLRS